MGPTESAWIVPANLQDVIDLLLMLSIIIVVFNNIPSVYFAWLSFLPWKINDIMNFLFDQ